MRVFLVVITLAGCGSTDPAGRAQDSDLLGEAPLCEASDIARAPWDRRLFLVADNEVDEELFSFAVAGPRLAPRGRLRLPTKAPHDSEALAARGELLWLFGSHSRNKECEVRENRKRVLVLRRDGERLVAERRFESDEASWSSRADRCLAEHFAAPAPPGAAELCAAIVDAARLGTPARCEVLSIEGAVDLGAEGLFVGLRAPLVDGKAVLLRVVEGAGTFQFDRVVFLDLGRRGIRGLTRDGESLYVVAGPPADREDAHALFRIAAAAAASGGPARPAVVGGALPTSSEGIVVEGGAAHVVIDGAIGDDDDGCERPSRQRRVPLAAR